MTTVAVFRAIFEVGNQELDNAAPINRTFVYTDQDEAMDKEEPFRMITRMTYVKGEAMNYFRGVLAAYDVKKATLIFERLT